MTKYCSRCQQTKSLAEFGNSSATKDGKQIWCRACMNLAKQAYRQRHAERLAAMSRDAYWRDHADTLRKNREYVERTRKRRQQVWKQYRETQKERISAYQRQYYLRVTKPKRQQHPREKKIALLQKREIQTNPIRLYRKSAGLTQTELGRMLGCSQSQIGAFERSLALLTASTTQKLAHALSLPHDQLRQAYLAYRERLTHLQKERRTCHTS